MRNASVLLMSALVAVACNKKPSEKQPEAQSAKEAMQLLCDAYQRSEAENANPAERALRISNWVAKEVTNPEVRALFASIGELGPSQRQQAIKAASNKHGVEPCALVAWMSPPLLLPEITTGGVLDMEPGTWMIVVTPNAIVVEGTSVVPLRNGILDPAQLEGPRIPRLTQYLEEVKKLGGARVALAIDPSLSYGVLMTVLFSAKQAKLDRVQLLVTQRSAMKQIPVRLPAPHPPAAGAAPGAAAEAVPLRLVVSVDRGRLALWSISGLEGTLGSPKLMLPIGDRPDLAPLVRAFEEIIQRRHGSSARSARDRELVAMFEPTTTMQTVAAVLAAARATDDKELFPELLLSAGFE